MTPEKLVMNSHFASSCPHYTRILKILPTLACIFFLFLITGVEFIYTVGTFPVFKKTEIFLANLSLLVSLIL